MYDIVLIVYCGLLICKNWIWHSIVTLISLINFYVLINLYFDLLIYNKIVYPILLLVLFFKISWIMYLI